MRMSAAAIVIVVMAAAAMTSVLVLVLMPVMMLMMMLMMMLVAACAAFLFVCFIFVCFVFAAACACVVRMRVGIFLHARPFLSIISSLDDMIISLHAPSVKRFCKILHSHLPNATQSATLYAAYYESISLVGAIFG